MGGFEQALALLLGLLLGSFLNVCIYRWPNDLSVMKPSRSFCPACEKQIAWFDNIPVLSFLLLRGKCGQCAATISWRYPVVEVILGLLFWWFVRQDGVSFLTLKACLFAFLMLGLIFSDLETMLLPDEMTIGGTVIGLGLSLWVPVKDGTFTFAAGLLDFAPGERWLSLGESALGAFAPSVAMWLMGVVFEKLRNKEGLGFGDVKMIATIGSFVGLMGALQTIVVASIAGSIVGLIWIKATKQATDTYQPFGSFLGAAALLTLLGGRDWFWNLFG